MKKVELEGYTAEVSMDLPRETDLPEIVPEPMPVSVLVNALEALAAHTVPRLVDVVLAIPALLLSMALITILGYGLVNVAIAVEMRPKGACGRVRLARVGDCSRRMPVIQASTEPRARLSGSILRMPQHD